MKNFLTLVCIAALFYASANAKAADGKASYTNGPRVEIGIDIAGKDWKVTSTSFNSDNENLSIGDTGAAGGVSFRYTRPTKKKNTRWGIQVSASWADAPLTDRLNDLNNPPNPNIDPPYPPEADYALHKFKRDWTVNFMHRTSRDIDRLSPYIAFGASATRVTITRSIHESNHNILESYSRKDSEDHFGWIIALGTDIEVSKKTSMNIQVDYANYGDKTYTTDAKVNLRAASLRLGMIIRL